MSRSKPLEVVALHGATASLQRLATGLRDAGLRVDVVDGLDELRTAFFSRGGHDALVIGPDVRLPVARAATECLASLDNDLRVLVFGDPRAPHAEGIRRGPGSPGVSATNTDFHPSSRAGLGAVLRLLQPDVSS